MDVDEVRVLCPYCRELVSIFVEPDVDGDFVQDCEVCCNPWAVWVKHDGEGIPQVQVARAQ
jgi:hypothetical protein